jgi:POT family proton-dependent oligopeptide transporter|tara:strand:- start:2587 stop:4101 length:1515 start_codon:yes stop_codon:yes gene_type:complete
LFYFFFYKVNLQNFESNNLQENQHPPGLRTLFFTEMWERMSFYGMRGILVLFMTATITQGGLNFNNISASAIYGIYAASVYLVTLPGGWIGDRLIGQQKAVLYGGFVIMIGHFFLALPNINTFYLGLIFVVLGTGLLKPNISAIVGTLYDKNESNRQSGFTIFYMAINIGSILGFFICGFLGEQIGWHYGFGAAGIGMALGLVQYIYSRSLLGEAGLYPSKKLSEKARKRTLKILSASLLIIIMFVVLVSFGLITLDPLPIANALTVFIASVAILYFTYIYVFGGLNQEEKKKIVMIFILFLGAAFFWAGFDQGGSSFNIFAKEYTNRIFLDWEYPASWLQVLNPALVVILSPFMAYLWIFLGKRMLDPSLPFKFGLGLILMAFGFVVVAMGAQVAISEGLAGAEWLLLTYLFHTLGELTLSPVGLSAISSLSPKRYVGQMMGIWFLASSLGAIIAGLLSGQATDEGLNSMPDLFNQIAIGSAAFGILLILIARPLHNWVFKES